MSEVCPQTQVPQGLPAPLGPKLYFYPINVLYPKKSSQSERNDHKPFWFWRPGMAALSLCRMPVNGDKPRTCLRNEGRLMGMGLDGSVACVLSVDARRGGWVGAPGRRASGHFSVWILSFLYKMYCHLIDHGHQLFHTISVSVRQSCKARCFLPL